MAGIVVAATMAFGSPASADGVRQWQLGPDGRWHGVPDVQRSHVPEATVSEPSVVPRPRPLVRSNVQSRAGVHGRPYHNHPRRFYRAPVRPVAPPVNLVPPLR